MKTKLPQCETPVEIYNVKGKKILVKRDDLVGNDRDTPPWGKHEAVGLLLDSMDLSIPFIHLNVYGSWSAWSMAYWSSIKDFEFVMSHPKQKNFNEENEYMEIVESFGCNFFPLKPNVGGVLIGQTKRYAEEKGFQMIPYAFDTELFADYLSQRVYQTVKSILKNEGVQVKTLVMVSGTGTTCLAMAKGFFNAGGKYIKTVAVSSAKTVQKKVQIEDKEISVIQSPNKFSDRMDKYEVPFPCSPFWEKKGWNFIENNIDDLKGPVLFWNLGGDYPF